MAQLLYVNAEGPQVRAADCQGTAAVVGGRPVPTQSECTTARPDQICLIHSCFALYVLLATCGLVASEGAAAVMLWVQSIIDRSLLRLKAALS